MRRLLLLLLCSSTTTIVSPRCQAQTTIFIDTYQFTDNERGNGMDSLVARIARYSEILDDIQLFYFANAREPRIITSTSEANAFVTDSLPGWNNKNVKSDHVFNRTKLINYAVSHENPLPITKNQVYILLEHNKRLINQLIRPIIAISSDGLVDNCIIDDDYQIHILVWSGENFILTEISDLCSHE